LTLSFTSLYRSQYICYNCPTKTRQMVMTRMPAVEHQGVALLPGYFRGSYLESAEQSNNRRPFPKGTRGKTPYCSFLLNFLRRSHGPGLQFCLRLHLHPVITKCFLLPFRRSLFIYFHPLTTSDYHLGNDKHSYSKVFWRTISEDKDAFTLRFEYHDN
jgi:hypothetical protein